jgi:hypothetical protein
MSFEVFVQCFSHGEPDGIAIADIQQAFGPKLKKEDGPWWNLRYDEENECAIHMKFLPRNRNLVHSLTVHRPCADLRLWKSLLTILKLGNIVLYFPAEKPPLVVADNSVSEHLPRDMVAAMGPITRVTRAQEILDVIKQS